MFSFKWEGVGASKGLFGSFSVHIKYVVGKMNLSFPLPRGSHKAFFIHMRQQQQQCLGSTPFSCPTCRV